MGFTGYHWRLNDLLSNPLDMSNVFVKKFFVYWLNSGTSTHSKSTADLLKISNISTLLHE
jgi:hypothetical protein